MGKTSYVQIGEDLRARGLRQRAGARELGARGIPSFDADLRFLQARGRGRLSEPQSPGRHSWLKRDNSLTVMKETTPPRCRVLLADDHAIVRAGFRCLLEAGGDIEVIGEAGDGEEAVAKIAALAPDLALVDVCMPRLDGIEVTRRVAASRQPTRVLAVTAIEDAHTIQQVLAAGGAGYLPKSAAGADLVSAVRTVAAGELYVHRSVVGDILRHQFRGEAAELLTEREVEVLRGIALGYSNKEIAARHDLSVKTVETYKARAMAKLGLRSRVEIVRHALRRGWLGAAGG